MIMIVTLVSRVARFAVGLLLPLLKETRGRRPRSVGAEVLPRSITVRSTIATTFLLSCFTVFTLYTSYVYPVGERPFKVLDQGAVWIYTLYCQYSR